MKKTIDNYLAQHRFLMVNKELVEAIGLDRTAVLSELIDKYVYFRNNNMLFEENWFYYTYERFDKIGLKRKRIDSIINFLQKIGFIETKNAGSPRRRYFKLNEEKIIDFIEGKSSQGSNGADVNTQDLMEKIIDEILEKQEDQFDEINGSICPKEQMDLSKRANGFVQKSKWICPKEQTLIENRIIKPDEEKQNMCVHTHEKNFSIKEEEKLLIKEDGNLLTKEEKNLLTKEEENLLNNKSEKEKEILDSFIRAIEKTNEQYPVKENTLNPEQCVRYIEKITSAFCDDSYYIPNVMTLRKDKQALIENSHDIMQTANYSLRERVYNDKLLSLEKIAEKILKVIKIKKILTKEKEGGGNKFFQELYSYWLGGIAVPTIQFVLNPNNYVRIDEVYNRVKW